VVRPIFIHDRGADAFAFYREVTDDLDAGFVVSANQNRCIQTPSGTDGRLIDWSEDLPEQGRTAIEIDQGSRREAREAELIVKAGSCELLPPKNDPTHADPVEVNVVRIDELGKQDEPIQWVLLTTESVATFSDSLSVIEFYRARWTIEDWHKVLKTGCRIEERRLETWERMEVLLSVYSVIAWKVLELRELARGDAHCPPDVLLSETERSILETRVVSATDEYSDSVFSVMSASRRFEVVEHLSNEELDNAINVAQKTDETRLVRRLCFVKTLYEGKTQQHAGAAVGVSQPTSSRWARAWNQDGIEGLRPRFGGGRPPKLTPTQWDDICAVLEDDQPWTPREIHALIEDTYGVTYHPTHLARKLRASGMHYAKPRPMDPRSPDDADEILAERLGQALGEDHQEEDDPIVLGFFR